MWNRLIRNYHKGYKIVLKEHLDDRSANGLSNEKYPKTMDKIKLHILAVGASMALSVADKLDQEEPHVPKSVWVAMGYFLLLSALLWFDVI